MFFVFGSPRSGTTLLSQTLAAHSQIEIPYETDFIVPAAFVFDRVRDPAAGRPLLHTLMTRSTAFKGSLGQYLDAELLREIVQAADYSLPSLLEGVYAAVARKAGKSMAGDKSPNDLQFIRMLTKHLAAAPGIRLIHLVRDVRDVMVSVRERNWSQDLEFYFPRMWSMSNLYLRDLYRDETARYHLVRYEDLVQDPEGGFQQLCGFLGVEFEPGMLDPGQRHPRFKRMPHHQRLLGPLTGERVGVHREQLAVELREAYERQAGEALKAFGYL